MSSMSVDEMEKAGGLSGAESGGDVKWATPSSSRRASVIRRRKKARANIQNVENQKLDPRQITLLFFRETGLYLLFLIIFSVITLSPRSGNKNFVLSSQLKDYLVDEEFPQSASHIRKTFQDIGTFEEFWQYTRDVLVNQLYTREYYNGDSFTGVKESQLVLYQNVLLGAVRLRQLRVDSVTCPISNRMDSVSPRCYPVYDEETEDESNIAHTVVNADFDEAWEWQSTHDLDGLTYWGRIDIYQGSGFVADLPSDNRTKSSEYLTYLYNNKWLDRSTRAVFIDFTLFNANLNLFSVIRLLVEFPPTGGSVPTSVFRSLPLFKYVSTGDYVVLVFELLFVCMVLYYTLEEIADIYSEGWDYFKSLWNYIDWINLVFFYLTIAMRIKVLYDVQDLEVKPSPTEYTNFQPIAFWAQQESNVNAVNAFLIWFKLFKYLQIFPRLSVLSKTIKKAFLDLASFFLMFFIIFIGFSMAFYISVGFDLYAYSSVGKSMSTLFTAALGDFDFRELQDANRVLGPFLFTLYMVLVFFILANMFIAIISGSYDHVQDKIRSTTNRNEVFEYMKASVLSRFQRYQKRILDADCNDDGTLDREEFVRLRERFGQDIEFLEILSKYDRDSDQRLDRKETKCLMRELTKKIREANHRSIAQQLRDDARVREAQAEKEKEPEQQGVLEEIRDTLRELRGTIVQNRRDLDRIMEHMSIPI
eukprot:TRINITY_DN413_c0_g1_i1.p1 TRINITY_DN413_c0_g1~~TRINITY_DN413_c0_g1_i1.p1  ORF type:complete len:703 (+),score=182.28 TRINITY_DN413_c0_g1_i1:265-2373(+)